MKISKSLNKKAIEILSLIQGETGKVFHLVEDFEDVLTLHMLAEEVDCPGTYENKCVLLDIPIRCGDLDLYRITFGGILWLDDVNDWFSDDEIMQSCCTLYAMANCRTPEKLLKLNTRSACRKVVSRWIKKNASSVDSIETCIQHLLPKESFIPKKKSDDVGYGPLISMLCAELGKTPKYWLWECSAELVAELINDLSAIKWDQQGSEGINPFTRHMLATKELHYFKNKLLEKYAE